MDVRTCPRACPPTVPVTHRPRACTIGPGGMGGPASSTSSSTQDAGRVDHSLWRDGSSSDIRWLVYACDRNPRYRALRTHKVEVRLWARGIQWFALAMPLFREGMLSGQVQ